MLDAPALTADDVMVLREAVLQSLRGAESLEAATQSLCSAMHAAEPSSGRACVLVRCYITHRYGGLPADIQRFAKRAYGAMAITPPDPEMRCLTLVGTAGELPEWNERKSSKGHQAIPLPSPHVVERAPMVAQLVRELGLDLARVVRPVPQILGGLDAQRQGLFHVESASGSPYIPAQSEFVERFRVASVVGFGGPLPSGELFATIFFSRARIASAVAEHFRAIGAQVLGVISNLERRVFASA